MKRLATLALAAAALSAGVASAQYDPFWDVNKSVEQSQRAQSATRADAHRDTYKAPARFQPAPLEQQTNYGPA